MQLTLSTGLPTILQNGVQYPISLLRIAENFVSTSGVRILYPISTLPFFVKLKSLITIAELQIRLNY